MNTIPMFHECSTHPATTMPDGWTWAETLANARTEAAQLRDPNIPATLPTPRPTVQTMTYQFTLTCPQCGRPTEHLASSGINPHISTETRATAQCRPCNHTYLIDIRVTSNRYMARRERAHQETVEHYAAQAIAARELART